MKKYILTLSALFILFIGFSQNWSLVMPNDTLVYEQQSNHQFFTIWVDSTHFSAMDTTYFMNRLQVGNYLGVDTVNYSLCGLSFGNVYDSYETEKMQFIGASLTVSNHKWTMDTDSNEVVIFPERSLGSSWLADSITGDSMQITQVQWEYLNGFETYDSVKVFRIKNKMIRVSRSHGVISGFAEDWPIQTFVLVGVQNLDLGEVVPMGLDFYNYEIGDVFCYGRYTGTSDSQDFKKIKTTVTNKRVYGDTVKYSFDHPQFSDLVYWPGKDVFIDAFPNTLAFRESNYCTGWSFSIPYKVLVGRNSKGEIVKVNFPSFDYDSSLYWGVGFWDINQYCMNDSLNHLRNIIRDGTYMLFEPGRGLVKDGHNGLYTCASTLMGYVKNGDTVGEISGMEEDLINSKISMYPNPVKDQLYITTEEQKPMGVSIYNLVGQLLEEKTFSVETTLDVTQWNSSLVLVVIRNQNGKILTQKKVSVL